jgi:hypothetical protein
VLYLGSMHEAMVQTPILQKEKRKEKREGRNYRE